MSVLHRPDQGIGAFELDDPLSGYYNDLSPVLEEHESLDAAEDWLDRQLENRTAANPVGVVQLGLAAWQRGQIADQLSERAKLYRIVDTVADWLVVELATPETALTYRWDMPHTYELVAPWRSSMAFGQAISLLVRAGRAYRKATADKLSATDRLEAAQRAAQLLLDSAQNGDSLAPTIAGGAVFQEYPTSPPASVLNGWIWTLWGLHDAARADLPAGMEAQKAFEQGVAHLAGQLPRYQVGRGWSRYDLYPHPIRHWASPFYHRLHVAQLRATNRLLPNADIEAWAETFDRAARRPTTLGRAVLAKTAFRFLRPRRKA